ncbi:hypothetical protein CHS0354_000643 [Potamilus streckersoni]|uniref:ABC transporter domain-containing protein n=1 Tax=Potamilus streckersoni TaxID=2493646 RepID=A0AAE0W7I0_9BIVA|nr:hypothetical protein CHS0354_000643 [Potamilus streckersoni]
MNKFILWTIGDGNGISPEIILKSFQLLLKEKKGAHFPQIAVVGPFQILQDTIVRLKIDVKIERIKIERIRRENNDLNLDKETLYIIEPVPESAYKISYGQISKEMGYLSLDAIRIAAQLCKEELALGMVTAPIHKKSIQLAGSLFHGHTELLGTLCGDIKTQMLFYDRVSQLKLALATTHVPLSQVSYELQKSSFLALLGVNPHASDLGVIGTEETTFLLDELKDLQPDAFFGMRHYLNFDVTVAMYHDQGLIPFKMLAWETGVNVTLGLPFVRTSPDHGTGFDIAGRGTARPDSFLAAHNTASIPQKVQSALKQVDLLHKQYDMPSSLSGGEQQKVAIARAIVREPNVILADEPTANLDAKSSEEIMNILHKLKKRNIAVIIVTHDHDIISRFPAKTYLMENGKLEAVEIETTP